jgi:drug/metabolite transporter (DMT)-like permease
MKLIYLKLLSTAIFWGGTFIAGRMIAGHVSPFSAAFLRFTVATIFLFPLTKKIEGRFPIVNKAQFFIVFLLGLTGVFSYNFFFFKGLSLIPAGRASLIIANNPIFIALFSFLLFSENLDAKKVLGIIISVTGAAIAISRGNMADLISGGLGVGDLYIFICVVSWVTYSLIGKFAMQNSSPLTVVSLSALIGSMLLIFPAIHEGMISDMIMYTALDWGSIFYLGFFGTVIGFVWYYEGIKKIGPAKAGLFINFVPISAIVLAFLILNEPITVSLGIGAVLVTTGVYMTNSGTAEKQRPAEKAIRI